MTIREAIDFLQRQKNKDLTIFIPGDGGFFTPCFKDSGIAQNDHEEDIFILLPCYGHGEKIELDVNPDDFEINEN